MLVLSLGEINKVNLKSICFSLNLINIYLLSLFKEITSRAYHKKNGDQGDLGFIDVKMEF